MSLGGHRVKLLNSAAALYSTIAIGMEADGRAMQRSGFTYLLHKGNAGGKIHEMIVTDVDKLVSADEREASRTSPVTESPSTSAMGQKRRFEELSASSGVHR